MTCCTILTSFFSYDSYCDLYLLTHLLMTHLACMVTHCYFQYHQSWLDSSLYKPHKPSSTFLRLVFVCLLENTIVLTLHSCVIPLPLPFTLIVLNLGQSP